MTAKAHYLEIYDKLNKSVAEVKNLIKPLLPLEKNGQDLIKKIKDVRQELDKIFAHPVLYQICADCHKRSQGGCCKNKRDSYLSQSDLIYAVAENTNFELPQPDLNFLTSLDNIVCLFLGPKNCLLKENRPIICLKQICDETPFKEQIANLLNDLDKKTKSLSNLVGIFCFLPPDRLERSLFSSGGRCFVH